MSTEGACVVKVDYLGVIHHALECSEEEYSVRLGSTAKDLLRRLVERHGEQFGASILGSDGQLRWMVKVYLNNREISTLKGLDTPITAESRLSVLVGVIPIGGG